MQLATPEPTLHRKSGQETTSFLTQFPTYFSTQFSTSEIYLYNFQNREISKIDSISIQKRDTTSLLRLLRFSVTNCETLSNIFVTFSLHFISCIHKMSRVCFAVFVLYFEGEPSFNLIILLYLYYDSTFNLLIYKSLTIKYIRNT